MKWRAKGETNSVTERSVSPRLNLIAAIDTLGNAYLSILQVNTDTGVFCLYMQKLIAKI